MSKCHDVHAESIEIDLFRCKKEAYVYQIPSATTSGHRAELWRLDEWLAEVSVRVVRRGDDTGRDEAVIRLETTATGELFAEAPVKLPLRTSIEPVIDSSRYFVLRVVDANSGAHAFIGLGFRDREHASDFMAALDDHAKYVQRQIQAEEMKHQAQSNADGHAATGDAVNSQTPSSTDLAFKPGERVVLPLHAETTGELRLDFLFGLHGGKTRVCVMSPVVFRGKK
jgi:adaptin ear-binding coat-associated protein 1/2